MDRCDRILSFGSGLKLLEYSRAELKLSDHRPVKAIFTADVEEVFFQRKFMRTRPLGDDL